MNTSNNDHYNGHYLWILFLSLVSILFFVSLYVLWRRVCCIWERYCICQGWCCIFDVNAYRREREHLRRVRELRRRREEIVFATFTQIPGPVPDVDLRTIAALQNLTTLGFVIVTPVSVRQDANSIQMRDQLTADQRREILDRVLSCRVR